jgi:hypothetical protein
MSIFDQVEEEEGVDLGAAGWVNAATALATHQATKDAMKVKSVYQKVLTRPRLTEVGTINVAKSIVITKGYSDIITDDQTVDARFRPTADDVIDGGMKRGSKVVIQVVPESSQYKSWDEAVRGVLLKEGFSLTFDKFSVLSVTEPDSERYTIHETFGGDFIQTFGSRPRIYSISGQVLNGRLDVRRAGEARSMDWKNAFQRYYEQYFSAHACVRNRNKVRIFVQDTVLEGYALAFVSVLSAESQSIAQVTITFVVSDRRWPRQNDRNIPGYYKPNGFRITGAVVPKEYFPQPRLELYFQNDPANILKKQKGNKILLINRTCAEIAKLDGKISADVLKKRSEDQDNWGLKFYGEGLSLRKIMVQGTNISTTLDEFIKESSALKAEIQQYNKSKFNIDSSNEVQGSLHDGDGLRARLAVVRIKKSGLIRSLSEINNKCLILETAAQDLKSLPQAL